MQLRRLGGLLLLTVLGLAGARCGSQSPTTPTPPPASSPAEPGVTPSPPQGGLFVPPPMVSNVLVGAGDIATCDANPELTARLLDTIGGTVITLGDNAYPAGADQEFRECYDPTWGRHKSRTRPSPGNHDYESPGATPYYAYFGENAGPPGLGYYSYEVDSWLVLSLNSNANIEAQVKWLNDLFDRRTYRCTLAYWHHPFYSSGPSAKLAHIQRLWDVLYHRGGAEVVLSGHDHLYERFAPQDERGRIDLERGIRQFVVGTGGGGLDRARVLAPHSEMLIAGFGVLKLTLSSGGYAWEYISVAGPGDSGSGECH